MKQLLIRVPDDLHRRVTARAAAAGISVNTLATNALDIATLAATPTTAATVLRLRAATAGILGFTAQPTNAPSLEKVQAELAALSLTADELIRDQRGTL